jgi:hypothetical protein
LAGVAVIAVAGLGAGVAIAATSGGSPATSSTAPSSPYGPGYSYYRSMMGRYFGGSPMMGGTGGYRWMMGAAGYRWMFGGASAPAWMRGEQLPAAMMGTGADPGQVMGRLWASAPGPRVSPSQAAALGSQVPADAHIDRAARTITFTTSSVHLTAVASPVGGPDETFRIAGMVNPHRDGPGRRQGQHSAHQHRPRHRPRPGHQRQQRPVLVDADDDRPARLPRLGAVVPR